MGSCPALERLNAEIKLLSFPFLSFPFLWSSLSLSSESWYNNCVSAVRAHLSLRTKMMYRRIVYFVYVPFPVIRFCVKKDNLSAPLHLLKPLSFTVRGPAEFDLNSKWGWEKDAIQPLLLIFPFKVNPINILLWNIPNHTIAGMQKGVNDFLPDMFWSFSSHQNVKYRCTLFAVELRYEWRI